MLRCNFQSHLLLRGKIQSLVLSDSSPCLFERNISCSFVKLEPTGTTSEVEDESEAELNCNLSLVLATLAKSCFTAAFTLIFVYEIGDKTFFIAALLAMQYEKGLVLLGSMGALSLMTILSVVIGWIFHSVPTQFQTTLPKGEYSAVALLMLFGFKAIKDAWELPSGVTKSSKESPELGELVEAEKLVKEKVAKKLTNPLEIIWKSFSLEFSASPWGVASGAIAGHLVATSIAIIGGAFFAKYISEKLVGYLGGVLFPIFAVVTLLGVFVPSGCLSMYFGMKNYRRA